MEQPDTDKGTALFLYWYMNPQFFKNIKDREECEKDGGWISKIMILWKILKKIIFQVFIKIKNMLFDPKNDVYSGYDWTKEVDEDEMKAKIPEEMYIALEGEVLESPGWEEGIPDDIIPIFDKLCEASRRIKMKI